MLEKVPELEKVVFRLKNNGFTCFAYKGKEIAHFDNGFELDVRLTRALIEKEGLTHPSDSKSHPHRTKTKPHWIVLQLDKFGCDEIIRLVKLAILQMKK